MCRPTLALVVAVLSMPLPLVAQTSGGASDLPRVTAHRVSTPPVIDGKGDDATWAEVPAVDQFWQMMPDEQAPPSQATEFRIAYDNDNLYVLVRAFDAHPDSILRALARRDMWAPSDWIGLLIDSYHDRRSGFEFHVNPDGVKRDMALSNDTNEDSSWDGVWDVSTTVDERGWTAEFRIPLSQLRYPDAPENTFGFAVFRDIQRHNEKATWPRISRSINGTASQIGVLDGLSGLRSGRAAELTPYVVGKSETQARASGGYRRAEDMAVGSDMKLKVSPNFTVDATVNPDFGQVEADPAVLNLDAFETFLGEKRPFFLEGNSLYRLNLNCSIVNCSNESLIYSRRIGRAPELGGKYGDATTPSATPIAVAAKVTGQSGRGLSLGALSAVTRRVAGLSDRTAEPLTNRAALVIDQNLSGGLAGLRVTATAVDRTLDGWTAPYMSRSAYTAALSERMRFGGAKYELNGWLAGSRIAGSPPAVALVQTNAVHYFQQPGDDPVVDSTRTSMSGTAFQVTIGKNSGGFTRFQSSLIRLSSGFEANDLGYLQRVDELNWSTWGSLQFNRPTRIYNTFSWNGNVWRWWNTSGTPIQMAINSNAHLFFHNNWSVHSGFTLDHLGETSCDRCTRGGPLLRASRGFYPWLNLNGDSRRKVVPYLSFNFSRADEGGTKSWSSNLAVDLRASTRLDGHVGLFVGENHSDAQWIDNVVDGGTTHYVFAHMDQQTASMGVRVNYTAGPNFTLQFYGEPFVSRGTYTNFRQLGANPQATRFADRYIPYASMATGFHVRQLKTNTVLRWEYRPGSTLFFAWAHGRSASGGPTDLSWGDELDDLFHLHADNTFLIKVAHWISW